MVKVAVLAELASSVKVTVALRGATDVFAVYEMLWE
jgi:hypothetical protein